MNTPLVQKIETVLGDLLSMVTGALLAAGVLGLWWRWQERRK